MTAVTEATDACTAWLQSFLELPDESRRWVIEFILTSDELPDATRAALQERYGLEALA